MLADTRTLSLTSGLVRMGELQPLGAWVIFLRTQARSDIDDSSFFCLIQTQFLLFTANNNDEDPLDQGAGAKQTDSLTYNIHKY